MDHAKTSHDLYPKLTEAIALKNRAEFALKNNDVDACRLLFYRIACNKTHRFFPGFNQYGYCKSLVKHGYDLLEGSAKTGEQGSFENYYFVAKGAIAFWREDSAIFRYSLYGAFHAAERNLILKEWKKVSEIHRLGKDLMGGPLKKNWKSLKRLIRDQIQALKMRERPTR